MIPVNPRLRWRCNRVAGCVFPSGHVSRCIAPENGVRIAILLGRMHRALEAQIYGYEPRPGPNAVQLSTKWWTIED